MSYAHLKFVTNPSCDEEDSMSVGRASSAHSAGEGATKGPAKGTTGRPESSPATNWSNSREGYEMISMAAYFRAQKLGIADSDDVNNWLEAEKELLELLENGQY